jgi:hypothetical protein
LKRARDEEKIIFYDLVKMSVSWGAASGINPEETPSTKQGCDAIRRGGRLSATDRNDISRGTAMTPKRKRTPRA